MDQPFRKLSKNKELTEREKQIAVLVAQGWARKAIIDKIKIELKTYDSHRRNILLKLDLGGTNAAALVLVYCLRMGWLQFRDGEIHEC